MNAHSLARHGYARTSGPMRPPRRTEYEIIARITHRLKAAAQHGQTGFAALAAALHDNRELWATLAMDVADADNGLPRDVRARIFYLAEFTRVHTSRVLAGKADVAPLLEVNTAILRGLRQERPAA